MSTQKSLDDLVETLNLERLEENLIVVNVKKQLGEEFSVDKFLANLLALLTTP